MLSFLQSFFYFSSVPQVKENLHLKVKFHLFLFYFTVLWVSTHVSFQLILWTVYAILTFFILAGNILTINSLKFHDFSHRLIAVKKDNLRLQNDRRHSQFYFYYENDILLFFHDIKQIVLDTHCDLYICYAFSVFFINVCV